MKKLKIIDLFAGLGGIRLGFTQAAAARGYDVECVLTAEIKDYAIKVYRDNFGQDENIQGDIVKIDTKDIPDFDFLLAGFPCQPFSSAGLRKGFADTRGTMFFEIERILESKKPQGFLLENVEGLVTHDGGNTLTTIINKLIGLGYKVSWKLLDSADYGVAQSRKRVYIVGSLNEEVDLNIPKQPTKVLKDIQEKGLPTIDSDFTRKILSYYSTAQLHGKSIKDKRGGNNNIHSWDIGLRGPVTPEQANLLSEILKERRKKIWAEKKGMVWMDGMPLSEDEIKTFYTSPTLSSDLADLTKQGYLKFEHPKNLINGVRVKDTTKLPGFNIVSGKLSFEITKILHENEVTPTIVATDVGHIAVVDGNGLRNLTIREGLRLNGYPESYSIKNVDYNEAFDLLGNTVVVTVIKLLSDSILKNS